ncbi:MAG: Glutathione S-transferase GstB [Paracidovorax wautersii]|uniref:Glutathione S-transferase GstB n=1 Tax=Paracidovorax wautersii TaxID=1177982 RepID=A0A7V8FR11_9BURK|nr:MAG: Glutathione S-transferase GstB [Paracidovorax wautersii]
MLRIWGRISSINVRKVVWCAQELGLDFQRVDAGAAFGIVHTPEYRALNPNAMVPAIEDVDDDGQPLVLWESNVIVRYLCARHAKGTLYPAALAERFDAERWMDWQQTTLNPAGRDAFVQLIRTPAERRQPALIEASRTATDALLDLLEQQLTHRAFLAGDDFTMADIPVGCEMHRWWSLPLARPHRPHLDRWYNALRSRAGAAGVLDLTLS